MYDSCNGTNKEGILLGTKRGLTCFFGLILIAVGLFMLFNHTYVTTIRFYRFGRVSTGAILIILLIVDIIFAVARPSRISKILIGVILAAMVISLLLGMQIGFRSMTVLDVLLMLIPLAVGAGLVLKALLQKEDGDEK